MEDSSAMEMDFWRQLDIISPNELRETNVTVIGAGGIGSSTVLTLAKMGVRNLQVWDHDTVEDHNLPNQFYRLSDLGRPKVEALADIVADFTGVAIEPVNQRYRRGSKLSRPGIVISAVDSMSARKEIWLSVKSQSGLVSRYIDSRMGAEVGWIQVVDPSDPASCRRYVGSLYTDEQAFEAPCTARAIWYNAGCLAALIARVVKKIVKGQFVEQELMFDLNLFLFTSQVR
jgi:molybdopterin/thiamine biosynthesis adenylyltransferase